MTKKDAEKVADIVFEKLVALINTDEGPMNGILSDVIN